MKISLLGLEGLHILLHSERKGFSVSLAGLRSHSFAYPGEDCSDNMSYEWLETKLRLGSVEAFFSESLCKETENTIKKGGWGGEMSESGAD